MPYVSVPRDLSKVKNKVALGLTKRQLVCIVIAAALAIPVYLLLMPLGDAAIYIAIIPAVPPFIIGFYRAPDGRSLEAVLQNYIKVRYRFPRVRSYQVSNVYARLELAAKIREVIDSEHDSATNKENKAH